MWRLWPRAPLGRRSDRIQAGLTLGLVLMTLSGGPWAGWCAGDLAYRADIRATAWEREHHRQVAAVVVRDAPAVVADGGVAQPVRFDVSAVARWTGSDGATRSASITVPAGTRAGSAVSVWIDERGAVVMPPRSRNAALDGWAAATLTVAALTALLYGLRRLVIGGLDRHRLRSWEAEWRIFGPRWSRR